MRIEDKISFDIPEHLEVCWPKEEEQLLTLWEKAVPPDKIPEYPSYELKKAKGGEKTFGLKESTIFSPPEIFDTVAEVGELLRDVDMKYIPDWSANLAYRFHILGVCQEDQKERERQIVLCRSSLLYFVNTFVWTMDPRRKNPIIPFCTFPFQDVLLKWWIWLISRRDDSIVIKSRDMGCSWLMVVKNVWLVLFHPSIVNYQLSMAKDDVDDRTLDSLLGKFRFVLQNLPDWMRGGWEAERQGIDNVMSIKIPDTQALIKGKLTGSSGGRGGRALVV